MKNKSFLLVISSVIFLVTVFIVGSYIVKKDQHDEVTKQVSQNNDLLRSDLSVRKGTQDARVVITEFFDPECESCREFHTYLQSLMNDFDGKIQLVLRYAPFHHNSIFAVKILEASREQNLYWETLQLLYKYQPEWGSHENPRPELIWGYLQELKIDINKLKIDMDSSRIDQLLAKDIQDVKLLGVKATPTFFVNGKIVLEYGPVHLRNAIEDALKNLEN